MEQKVTKKLVMTFKTDYDRNVSLSVDNPKSSLNENTIKTAMQTIVTQNIFAPAGEQLVSLVEAKIVVTNTDEYEIA
jgi:hypothetical protein